jgi:SNF2 family DNA or RNA helicase
MNALEVDLWAHQVEALSFVDHVAKGHALLGMDMGTGKTLTAIKAVASRPDIRRVLVLAPIAALDVFPAQMRQYAPEVDWRFVGSHTARGRRLKPAERVKPLAECSDSADVRGGNARMVMVANYESVWRRPLSEAILGCEWDAIICDESHRLKSPRSEISLFAARLAKKYGGAMRLALTGTPMGQSPLDVWAQMRFVNPDVLERTWTQFRSRYAVMGGFEGRQVVAVRDLDDLMERISTSMFRVMLKDCIDLPLVSDIVVDVVPDVSLQRMYQEMRRTFLTELENGDELTAANAAVKVLRLAQITGMGDPKRSALAELLDEAGSNKVVVFCRFSADLATVRATCENAGLKYGEVSGSSKDLGPGGCWPIGQDAPQVLGVQIQAGGAGIDLTEANIGVYFSTSYSVQDYEQSRARLVRPGQKLPVRFYHLHVRGTVDGLIYRALGSKQDVVSLAYECLKKGMEDEEK